MRAAYQGGAPGVLISGLAWLIADAAWYVMDGFIAFLVLLVAGMLIFPLSLLVARLFRAPRVSQGNALNKLAIEATIPLFAGLLIAFVLAPRSPEFAFAALAIVIGARYFAFATLYRERVYWLLGGALFLIGTGFAVQAGALPVHVTLAVGAAELLFGALLFTRWNAAAAAAPAAA
nr:hypothetical protein [Sphingopyxis sp. KK2]